MAPEQAAGRSDTDGRVDIYALGVILYEMLCGRVPHRGDSMVRTLAMQMLDPVEPPSKVRPDLGIAPELEAVVMTALAKKREQRYQTMGELLVALDKAAKDVLPPPVGQSVTGSPVYALTPLPPGADPGTVASQPPAQQTSGVIATPINPESTGGVEPRRAHPISQSPDPRPKSPTTKRLKDEPEFVTNTERALSFDHLATEDMPVARPRRWPIVLFFALIAGGAAGAIGVVLKSRNDVDTKLSEHHDAGVPLADAAIIVDNPPADAGIVETPADAEVVVVISVDAGHYNPIPMHHTDGGTSLVTIDTPNHRGTLPIQVLTNPEGATLYDGNTYRGPGGTTVEAAPGTHMDITCKHPGYTPGTVSLVFDGKNDVMLCVAKRIKICINNIKNPFDDCELDPTKPIPGPPSP
jgi:hypothetical protein